MKIIPFNKIRELNIEPLDSYKWVVEAIKIKKDAQLPAKISLKPNVEGSFCTTMPVIIPNKRYGGTKVVTRYPNRVPSLDSEIMLYDMTTGENIAYMDGNWITAMRTGAVAAHSVKLFALENFSLIGMVGLGNTARATLKVLLALFPNRKLKIKLLKYKNQHELFVKAFENHSNIHFIYCDTYEEVIEDSDVVLSAATVFNQNVCEDKYFKKGVLVVPIHTRGFGNCDLFFDKVFADDTEHVRGFKYFSKFKNYAEVSDVVNGIKPGRENDSERIIAYNIGIALHDIYFAGEIYDLLKNDCEDIFLNAPTEKFWI